MPSNYLWRYTTFSSLLHILHTRSLTLLPTTSWEDRNDVHFLDEYKRINKFEEIYALCLSGKAQTFHHWRVFANGPDGVCITFKKKNLIQSANSNGNISQGNVNYLKKDEAKHSVNYKNMPFIKQSRYSDEAEYRFICGAPDCGAEVPYIGILPEDISRITLSPWLHPSLVSSSKTTLQTIDGFKKTDIKRSTLVDFHAWKNIATSGEYLI